MTGGGFRIRDLNMTIDVRSGEPVDSSFVNEVRWDVFPHWLDISARAAADAEAARLRAVAADLADNETFNREVEDEFRTSLVAMTAAAAAVEAFHASVTEHAPETKVAAKKRYAEILETLKRAFSLSTERRNGLREPLRDLFRLRNQAVHPPAKWAQPIRHPAFNLGMELRLVLFRAEHAVGAQRFAWNVIWVCLQNPNKKFKSLAAWCEERRDVVGEPPAELPDWVSRDD
jgi:hypothetical protein